MPTIALTDVAVRALPLPQSGQTTYWDSNLKGFGVRVSQGGAKSFVIVHGVNRQRRTLGKYPLISLKQAREKAKTLLAHITLGMEQHRSISYQDAREAFIAACQAKNKKNTVDYYRKRLDAHFRFGRKRLDEITRSDLLSRVRRIKTSASEQHHAFVVMRTFLNWALREQYLETSPLASVKPPAPAKPRDRVLTDTELASVFCHAQSHPYPFGPIVSLLILTGMRRNEVANLKWEWIDEKEQKIILPSDLTKNKRVHIMPYGNLVAVTLGQVPNWSTRLFPSASSSGTVFNGWGNSKSRFDRELSEVEPYTLHDLRRTFATAHAKIGTPIHVTEKLLNHVSGTISGVAAIYNRHSYLDEMRDAIEAYDGFIENLINP